MDLILTNKVDIDGNPIWQVVGAASHETIYRTQNNGAPVGDPSEWREVPVHEMWPGPLRPASDVEPPFRPERKRKVDSLQEFPSGAKRNPLEGKPRRYDQVPIVGLRRVAETAAEGMEHYGVGSSWWWQQDKPFPSSSLLSRAMEHIEMYRSGNRDEDHLAHACWNLMVLMQNEEFAPDANDIVTPPLGSIHPRH